MSVCMYVYMYVQRYVYVYMCLSVDSIHLELILSSIDPHMILHPQEHAELHSIIIQIL